MFALVLLFGGGGAPAPLMQAVLECLGLFWLLYLLWSHRFERPLPGDARWPLLIVAAMFVLALVHIVPLPPALWTALPGREAAAAIIASVGLTTSWLPISLVPEGTRIALLQLIPATALLIGAFSISREERLKLVPIPIAVAVFSALLGAMQFVSRGDASLYFFSRSIIGSASGIFANRNFQADFLLAAILLVALRVRFIRTDADRPGLAASQLALLWAAPIPLFAIMVLATLSRTGALLLGPALLIAAFLATPRRWRTTALAAAGIAAVAVVGAFLWSPAFLVPLTTRFQSTNGRTEFWPDLWAAAVKYFPVGSGLGSFEPVFRGVESLAIVKPSYFNHAHNDYFELLIETGIPGITVLAAFLTLYASRMWRVWRVPSPSEYGWLQRVAGLVIALPLLHAAVDYPLRTMTLQALFAVMLAILCDSTGDARQRTRRPV